MSRNILHKKLMWICVLFMIVPLGVCAQEVVSLKMDTVNGKLAIGVELEGKVEINDYTIGVYVYSVKFIVPKKYKFEQTIESISFGLSKYLKRGSTKWDIYENSNVIQVKKTMKPGEEFELKDMTFQIPVQDFSDFQDKWLTLQIEGLTIEKRGRKETPGYVFAHSDEDIFR